MNREEFVDEHKHEFYGWLLDAATRSRTGGELSLFMKAYEAKVDLELGRVFDELHNDLPMLKVKK